MNSFIKYATLILCMFCASWINAQTIERKVINTTGGLLAPSGGPQLHHNVGETFSSTLSSGGYMLTQGFIQPIVASIPPITGTLSVCAGSSTTLGNTASGGSWSSSNASVATIGSTGIVAGLLAGTSTISYTVGGSSVTAIVTVNALPNAGTISGTASICPGGATTFSTSSTMTGSWSSTNTAVGTVAAITGAFTGLSVGTTTISYTVTNGCGTVAATRVVSVNPLPVAGIISGTSSMCPGGTSTFSTSSTMTGSWSSTDTAVATVSAGGLVIGLSIGTTTISYTVSNGCGIAHATQVVTVISTPSSGVMNGATTACVGATTTYSMTPSTRLFVLNPSAIAGEKPVGNAAFGGTYTITNQSAKYAPLSDTLACSAITAGYFSGKVAIVRRGTCSFGFKAQIAQDAGALAVIIVDNTTSTTPVSLGGTAPTVTIPVYGVTKADGLTLINQLNLGQDVRVTVGIDSVWTGVWSSNNTSVATVGSTGVVTGVGAGTASIQYAVTSDCGSTVATKTITVNALPNVGTISGTATLCVAGTTTLTTTGSGGVWSSTNTAVGTVNPSTGLVTGISVGTAMISYTATNSCGSAAATQVVTVSSTPSAGAISGAATVCVGATTNLSSSGTSGGVWSSTNTAVGTVNASTGVVTGIAMGTTTISYTVTSSCGSVAATMVVSVNPLATPGTISGTASVCVGATTNLSTSGTSGGVWSSTNTAAGTVSTSGVVTGMAAGTTTISYTVSNECGSVSATQTITVNPLPNAGTITGASSVNSGAAITLSNTTSGGTWSSSGPAIATVGSTGIVSGVSPGTTTISYTVTNGCGSASATKTVTVNAVLETGITGTLTVCVGSTTTLSNATSGGSWSSSNTLVAVVNTAGEVTGINAGTTVISYTISGTSVTAIVTVNALPVAGTLSGATSVCAGSTATVSKTGTGGEWSSSETSIATVGTTGIVSGLTEGTTTISYTVSNGCGSVAATRVVTVIATPNAGTISGESSICRTTTTTLSSSVSGGTWSSNYPAGATVNASTGLVTGVAAGSFIISYRITNSCGTAYAMFPISIINAPVLGVISGATTVCEAATTTLTNTTAGGTWSSTNTGVATINAATGAATGVAAGTTTISYNVTNICGSATVSRALTVNPLPVAAVISGTTTLSAGTTTTLTATPSGGTWLSASGTIASINASTGVTTGVAIGVATVSFTKTNSCGSVVTTVAVTVTAAITPITGTRVVCQGATTNLANATPGGTWSTADGAIATIGTTGILTGVGAGTTNVTYTFSGGGNVTATVTVNAAPAAYTGSGILCSGSQLNLGSIIPGCTWTSGTAARATVGLTTGIVTGGTTLGTVNISYTSGGCRTITQLTVTAAVGATTGISSPCLGSTFTALNSTPGGTWSSSNTDRATIDATSGLLTAVGGGTVTISYTISAGCVRTTTVTVGTPPAITGNPSVCIGQTSLLVSSGGTWSSSNPTIASVAASGVVTGVTLGNAVITYRSTANALCFVTQTVTVNPLPSAIVAPGALCPGQIATLTSTPSGGTWTSTFPTKASVDPSTGIVTAVIYNFSAISVVNITYTLPTGCGGIATVTVNPLPSPIGGNRNICVASTTTLTSSTAGGTWSSASPAIASAAGSVITGVTGGLATISYTNALGCANTTEVTVNAMPGANTGTSTLCLPGGTTTLSNPAGAGTWSSSNTTKATVNFSSGLVTGINTGTANITYTKAAGCTSVTEVTVSMCSARPGMAEDDENSNIFSVSPNPTTGAINLTTSILGKVEIYTIDGKLLEQYEAKVGTTIISLPSGIASGVYMLRFNGADGSSKMVRLVYQQ